jgi:2-hydroxy-3-keto-5-methylthiopentenyl-1-phosphate phosphatase
MTISSKHFNKLVKLISNNYDQKTNKINMGFISELSNYLKEQNNRFDSLDFFNSINNEIKSVVEKQK